jgi:endonuclease/exonuclease/phosphatase family metal-dependent hydrolase
VEQRLRAQPGLNLVVLGDFNDLPRSEPVRKIIGPRGRSALIDTRPGERPLEKLASVPGDHASSAVTWTYHYPRDDAYTRVDYILLSRGMAREWQPAHSFVLAMPDWAAASDHRPVLAGFFAKDM